MTFDRTKLPDPQAYFEGEGLTLQGRGPWRTTQCRFHGGSDSLRIKIDSGSWVCMSCAEKGGDVLSYHMKAHGVEFVEAAKALGAWTDDGQPHRPQKPAPLPARDALQVLAREATLAAVAAGNVAHGVTLTDVDRFRLRAAAARINRIVEAFA
ncbi:MAG: CHC2 zinc finger domain-containing protein [Burkholderiales bacterium]|nr:CHC2 zinc finger domain-containing protein [Burkholderiales bacterium]